MCVFCLCWFHYWLTIYTRKTSAFGNGLEVHSTRQAIVSWRHVLLLPINAALKFHWLLKRAQGLDLCQILSPCGWGLNTRLITSFMFSIQMLLSWHWVSVLRPIKARWRCTPIQFILQARNTKSLTTMTSWRSVPQDHLGTFQTNIKFQK